MALDTFLRWLGISLELGGLIAAATGIVETRRHYSSAPGAWRTVKNAVRRARRRPIEQVQTGRWHHLSSGRPQGVEQFTMDRFPLGGGWRASAEDRVTALEHQAEFLNRTLHGWVPRMQREQLDWRRVVEEEHVAWRKGDIEIERSMRLLASGGLRLEAIGLMCIGFGTVLSSGSGEAASLIRAVTGIG